MRLALTLALLVSMIAASTPSEPAGSRGGTAETFECVGERVTAHFSGMPRASAVRRLAEACGVRVAGLDAVTHDAVSLDARGQSLADAVERVLSGTGASFLLVIGSVGRPQRLVVLSGATAPGPTSSLVVPTPTLHDAF
jgi:hypothetical protein